MSSRKNILYRGFTSKRRFGVELEASNNISKELILNVIERSSPNRKTKYDSYAQSVSNTYWHVKQDSSCGMATGVDRYTDKGWEIASFVGSGIQDAQHIGDVAESLMGAGLQVNNNCGLHVHVEVADFSPQQMGVLLAHWIKIEKFIMSIVPSRRRHSLYCEPIRFGLEGLDHAKKWTPTRLWQKLRPRDLQHHDNFYRWQSINLVNYALGLKDAGWQRKTIEFRIPEGTLAKAAVVNWVRLFVNFVDFIKYKPMPENLTTVPVETALYYLGIGHASNAFHILSPGLHTTRTWALERAVEYGVYAITAQNILNRMWEPVKKYN